MKKTPSNPPAVAPEPQGSFSMGLMLGVVGGALGMWLFHTDEGEETLKNLKSAWADWSQEHDLPAVPAEITEQLEQAATVIQDASAKFPKFRRKLPDAN